MFRRHRFLEPALPARCFPAFSLRGSDAVVPNLDGPHHQGAKQPRRHGKIARAAGYVAAGRPTEQDTAKGGLNDDIQPVELAR